ncbi:methyltransferase domain-containing protein [Ectothiorhodospiraceae bacterium WFHF3C12]|nr:methyltransferase domain-containing protein [Ectothiorhodospiraceae bacterium WFHF3C12]
MTNVANHYERDELLASLLNALAESGLDVDDLHPEDLAPLDEFHIGGRRATQEMIELAGIGPADHVLDVGAGIGGPARTMAAETGCRVTGVDLARSYCEVANDLTARVGLEGQVRFRQADALALPFEPGAFDVVWTQHMTMNVADKDALFAELARVLRPGGRLVCYEVLAGDTGGELHYPVPWADSAAISHLDTVEGMRRRLADAGLRIEQWQDRTEAALAFFQRMAARQDGSSSPRLGLHLLVGPDMSERTRNLTRNLEAGGVTVVLVLASRD